MMMMMKTLMMRGALMLMMIKMMILQAELDKRESQWAAAVDNLKLRNCDEQVLFYSVVVAAFLLLFFLLWDCLSQKVCDVTFQKKCIWASVHYNIIKLRNCLEQVHRNLMLLYFPSLMPFCPNVLFKCLFLKCSIQMFFSKCFVQIFYPNFFFKCLSKYLTQMIYQNVLPK